MGKTIWINQENVDYLEYVMERENLISYNDALDEIIGEYDGQLHQKIKERINHTTV